MNNDTHNATGVYRHFILMENVYSMTQGQWYTWSNTITLGHNPLSKNSNKENDMIRVLELALVFCFILFLDHRIIDSLIVP